MNVSTLYLCAISSFSLSPASISHSFLVSFPQFLSPLRPQTAAEKVWHLFRISMITLPKNVNGWKSGNVTRLRIEAWHYGRQRSSGCVRRGGECSSCHSCPVRGLVKGINQQLKVRCLRLIGV